MDFLLNLFYHNKVLCIVLIILIPFIVSFWIQSVRWLLWFRKIISQLEAIKKSPPPVSVKEDITRMMKAPPLNHLWSEYGETLHSQTENHEGEENIRTVRATVPAEMFFNTQVLVDTPLRSEFFKHLPGILTGLGIIGTFLGLISGLSDFQVSENPIDVRKSLEQLLKGVTDAFKFSLTAISLAMLVLLIEKIAITTLYKQVEKICQLIDSFFDAGVGEEYLSNIVKSSQQTATSTSQLKDGLIEDLKALLTNLTERQIEASQQNNQAIVQSLNESITNSLKEPMQALANTVQNVSQNQGQAVQSLLKDVLTAFMAKLEDTFGGQMSGINQMMLETTNAMKSMQDNFSQMLASMSTAGKDAGEAMGQQLKEAMTMAEKQQKEMNAHMEQFIIQIKELVSSTQSETNTQLKTMLGDLQENMGALLTTLSQQQTQVTESATQAQAELKTHTQSVVNNMSEQLDILVQQSVEANTTMKANIEALQKITIQSIDKMNTGADRLYEASDEFAKAGDSVTGVLAEASQLSNKLIASGQSLETTSRTVQNIVSEFQKTRDSIANMTSSLDSIIQRAQSEAGMTEELLAKMKSITDNFKQTQLDTEDYMKNISGVLEKTFSQFTDLMEKALHKSRTDFDKSLSEAVGRLSSIIEELSSIIEELAESQDRG